MLVWHNGSNTYTETSLIDSIYFENNRMKNAFGRFNSWNSLWDIDSITFVRRNCQEIQIGSQLWTCKNLNVHHYRNDDIIPEVRDSAEWANLTTGAWCYYNNDSALGAIYGKLYNWYAVNDPRGLAPEGWHVPTDAEWTTLTTYLGGDSISGGKMKETGTSHWQSPNAGATNESGFTALPGGALNYDGVFDLIDGYGFWWSSTETRATNAWSRALSYGSTDIGRGDNHKGCGFSVRCIKD